MFSGNGSGQPVFDRYAAFFNFEGLFNLYLWSCESVIQHAAFEKKVLI
jgi:hypothetical protein